MGYGEPTYRKQPKYWSMLPGGGYYHTKAEATKAAIDYGKENGLTEVSIYQQGKPMQTIKIKNPSRKHLSNPNKTLRGLLANLTPEQQQQLIREIDRFYYAAIDEGFTPSQAQVFAEKRAIPEARKMLKRSNPNNYYALWLYSNAPGVTSPTVTHYDNVDSAMRAASQVISYNTAKKLKIVYTPSGKVLHTWEHGSWRHGNPSTAEEISEGFHGRPPSETIDIDEEEQYTEELGVLGCLVELHITRDDGETSVKLRFPIPTDPKFKDGDEVYLAAANKHQMEFVGGDQEIVNLEEIAKHTDKQLVKLGCLDKVVYLTDKYHLDDSDGQEAEYVHELGKKKMFGFSNKRTGRPEVIYDTVNAQLKLVGGTYSITDEGIIN